MAMTGCATQGRELAVAQGLQQTVGYIGLGLVDLVDQDHAAIVGVGIVLRGRNALPNLACLTRRIPPVESPPQGTGAQEVTHRQPPPDTLLPLGERAAELSFRQAGDGVVVPEQIPGFGTGVDHMLHVGSLELLCRGLGELALANARLAPHQQGSPRGQRRVDRPDRVEVEDMGLPWKITSGGQPDGGPRLDFEKLHGLFSVAPGRISRRIPKRSRS